VYYVLESGCKGDLRKVLLVLCRWERQLRARVWEWRRYLPRGIMDSWICEDYKIGIVKIDSELVLFSDAHKGPGRGFWVRGKCMYVVCVSRSSREAMHESGI